MLGRSILKGGAQLSSVYAFQQALVFTRNILIARLIGPENFGLAVTFIIVISALEVISDIGVEQYIIRTNEIEYKNLQNTLHLILILRAALISIVIFFGSKYIAIIFGRPDMVWAYQALAIVPLLRGFTHLDMRRMQRKLIYTPSLLTTLTGSLVGFSIAVLVAVVWRSYEAVILALVGEAITVLLVSHLVAQRRYGIAVGRRELWDLIKYGWPLTLNGAVVFLMTQGDRLIVGSQLGVQELANYAVASILTAGPVLIVLKVTGALYVPMLTGLQPSDAAYIRRYEICGALTAILSFSFVLPLIYLGLDVATLLYGREYKINQIVIIALTIGAGARILRSWPLAAAISSGKTIEVLLPNILRSVGFPFALVAVLFGFGASGVAVIVASAELAAAAFALERADRLAATESKIGRKIYLIYITTCLSTLIALHLDWGAAHISAKIILTIISIIGSIYVLIVALRNFRLSIFSFIKTMLSHISHKWRS